LREFAKENEDKVEWTEEDIEERVQSLGENLYTQLKEEYNY
jgi:hypothetical protein